MHCKNCKHFVKKQPFAGSCENPNFKYGYRWDDQFSDYNPVAVLPDKSVYPNQILIENDEGWGAIVGQDFGCVHFQQNEQK